MYYWFLLLVRLNHWKKLIHHTAEEESHAIKPKMQRVLLSSQVFGEKLLFLTAPFGGYIDWSSIVGDSTMSYKIEVLYWKELRNVECLSVQSQTRFPQHD